MDPIQAAASLIQGAQALLQGVEALSRAIKDLQDAPQKLSQIEEILTDLSKLHSMITKNYSNKLHHQELNTQLSSFENLIRDFEVQLARAKKLVSRRKRSVKMKMYLTAVVTAVVGDELTDIVRAMNSQLVEWIRKNSIRETISNAFEKTAEKLTSYLRVQPQAGYRPLSKKAVKIRSLLEQKSSTKVIIIHGLSGMGKSCLARHIAADPPKKFHHGAVDLVLGQGCSRTASLNNRQEYHTRLAAKLGQLLRTLGRKKAEVEGIDLEDACQLLQETLIGRSILLVLDDVWESDIIARFMKLYDNECSYLATTRNQSVYETIEAEKLEIGQEDVQELSKTILMQHSQLSEEELPEAAELLIQRCGHHPLTLAVIGKALRQESRIEQWEKAIDDLSTYASQAPVPVHYLNEKEVESAATVFGSFDYSLNSMIPHAKELFIAFAALCWSNGPVPEPCLEAIWFSLEQNSNFRLVSGRLCEGSLLHRVSDMFYRVHDMVALYLETRVDEALNLLFSHSRDKEHTAALVPWIYHFGNRKAQKLAEEALTEVFWSNNEDLPATVLWNVVDVLSTSNTMLELEETSVNFSRLIGPELARLFLLQSEDLHAAVARCIANCFTTFDYETHTSALVQAGAPEKLACLLRSYSDTYVQRDAALVLARLAEFRHDESELVLKEVPLKELLDLLDPNVEETHEQVIYSLMTLAKAGEEVAVRYMFSAGVGKKLEEMLMAGSEAAQERAIVALKSFNELGGSTIVQSFLRSGILERLPWQMRLNLERLTVLERKASFNKRSAPMKRYQLIQQVNFLQNGSENDQFKALQEVAAIAEKAGNDPQVLEMILSTNLVEVLASKLETSTRSPSSRNSNKNSSSSYCSSQRIKSEACFAVAKLSSIGDLRCIKSMVKLKVLENLVHSMLAGCSSSESAYSALHSLIFSGKRLITEQLLRASLVEKIMVLVENGVEIGLHCVQDLVEVGGKECIERLILLRVVDKLAMVESRSKNHQRDGGLVVEFAKLVRKCSGLSAQEHRVVNQQVVRQARAVLKDPKQIAKISNLLRINNELRGEGSGSGSSGSSSKRRSSFGNSRSNSA